MKTKTKINSTAS